MMSKPVYRIQDWSRYNQVLKDRWSLDVWLSPEVAKQWYAQSKCRKRGSSFTYSHEAIKVCLTLRALFNLSLRATEGLISSLIKRLGLPLTCPSYSQVCRRAEAFGKLALPRVQKGEALYMLIDSTGLKVYGEGEWHVKMHKASKCRTWRKLHVAVDPVTQELLGAELTDSSCRDSAALPPLLKEIKDPLERVWADGAYDCRAVYEALYERGIWPVIPPRQGAQPSYAYHTQRYLGRRRLILTDPALFQRDQAIYFIDQFLDKKEGRRLWKKVSGYGLRSLVETAIMRFKRTFTDKLRSRKLSTQQAEIKIKAAILNRMLQIGFPYTVPVPSPAL
jgi:hypothetical protein